MKNLTVVAIFLAVFTFTSCSKDETNNEPENQESTIVGTWFLKTITINSVEKELSQCYLKSNMVFASDGSIVDNDFIATKQFGCTNDGLSGTYAILGEDITLKFVDGTPEKVVETVMYSFNVIGNTLSLTDSGDNAIATYTKQ